jgi:DNA invertase Pin-like site-specific DNA recombinase
MSGKLIGYIRVSTTEQNTERQLEGIKLDKIFTDKVSGRSVDRPALLEMIAYVRDGDTIIVHSMDRLARNLDDLRRLVKELTAKQVKIRFAKESLEFTGEDSPLSNLLLSVMGAFAEFERSLIKERQLEGITLAKKNGVYKGRKKALDAQQVKQLKERVSLGEVKTILAKEFNISRETLYHYLKNEQYA